MAARRIDRGGQRLRNVDDRGDAAYRAVADPLNPKRGEACGRAPGAFQGQGFDSPRLHLLTDTNSTPNGVRIKSL